MPAKPVEDRAADRLVANYSVPILAPPTTKRTVKGRVGLKPPKRPAIGG